MTRIALILLALGAAPLAAQEAPRGVPWPVFPRPVVQPGDRVRIHPRAAEEPIIGRWLGSEDGQARIEVAGNGTRTDTLLVALESIASLERSSGRSRKTGSGAAVGAAVGLFAGAVSGFASGDDPPGFMSMTAGDKALYGGLAGAGLGAIVGAIIGTTMVSDRWQVVPLIPTRPGAGPGIALSVELGR